MTNEFTNVISAHIPITGNPEFSEPFHFFASTISTVFRTGRQYLVFVLLIHNRSGGIGHCGADRLIADGEQGDNNGNKGLQYEDTDADLGAVGEILQPVIHIQG
jgi:hypothetical protein